MTKAAKGDSFMIDRIPALFSCLIIIVAIGFLSGCGHEYYEDQETGITVKELGSDLDNRWALRGVVVDSVKSGGTAEKASIKAGELISYIVDERRVKSVKEFEDALSEALKEDEKAALRILKSISVTTTAELGIGTKPDPEARGMVVISLESGSVADKAGIKLDAIISEIDGKSTRTVEEYDSVLTEALANPNPVKFSIIRSIIAPKLSKVGIEEVQGVSNGVKIIKIEQSESRGIPASMEGIMVGDVITSVIDEMKITDVNSYKKAIKKAADADRVTFKRGELGGIKLVVINALGQIGDIRALEPLLKALESDDKWIRRAAATALEEMNDEQIIEPFMWHLLEKNEEDAEVRRSSARALERMRPEKALAALAEALKDSSLRVRLGAGQALGRIGEPAIDILAEALNDPDSKVRDSAVAALGNIGGREDISPGSLDSVRKQLKTVLGNPDEESTVKLTAIQAFSKIIAAKDGDDPESIAELEKVAETGNPGLQAFVKELLPE